MKPEISGDVVVAFQVNVVPVTLDCRSTAVDAIPVQILWSIKLMTVGLGFTVIT